MKRTLFLVLFLTALLGISSVWANTVQAGADRLVEKQLSDGGWGWPLDGTVPSPANTIGPIGKGLAQAYLQTSDPDHLSALQLTGTKLLAKTNNFSSSDGYLAKALDDIFGSTTYVSHLNTNFYTSLANGTYDRNGLGTLYSTQTYVQYLRNARSGDYANLAAWDLGMALVAAAQCGVTGTELDYWIEGTKAEINELNAAGWYDVSGLAGALYGLAFVGADFDPTAGAHAAASSLADLANILASYQIDNGGFAWNSQYVIPDDYNESIQETAYAILALNEVNRTLYLENLIGAADYMASVQLDNGGWYGDEYWDQENNEITAEALWGYTFVYPDRVLNVTQNTSYSTIQAAIAAAVSGDEIHVSAGEYVEIGQIVINKNITIAGADKETTIIKPTQNTGSSGDARGWFLVQAGNEFNLSNVTLDGEGRLIYIAILCNGSGTIDNNIITNIGYAQFNGRGVAAYGDGMTISNNTISNIARIGIFVYGTGVSCTISGNTYIGKGPGDWLDYGIELSGGPYAVITGNEIYNVGDSYTEWSNSAILLTDKYGRGTSASITNNNFHDNSIAINVGYATNWEDESLVDPIEGNTFTNNYIHFRDRTVVGYSMDEIVADNTYNRYYVLGQYIYGNGTILYVDADKELIQAGETQTYRVYASYIEDLRGFTVQVTIPVEDFVDEPVIGEDLGPEFDGDPLITTEHTLTDWVFNVSGAYWGGYDGIDGENILLFTFDATASTVFDGTTDPFYNTPDGVCISITDAVLKDDQNPYNEIPWEADCFLVKIDGGLPTVEIVNILDYPDGMTLEVGAGGVIWPLLDLTYTDNYDLSTALYVIYPFGGTVPGAPADFTLPVGTIDGLTTTLADWQLPATTPDGTYVLYLLVTDDAGNFSILPWTFTIDTVAPGALTWVTCRTTPDANVSVDLGWTYDAENAPAFINVWALDYALTPNAHAYPEYDPTDLDPTITNDIDPYAETSALGWVKVAEIPVASQITVSTSEVESTIYGVSLDTVEWAAMARGYYYFTIFAEADNGQMSDPVADPFYRESISYWPGDVSAIDGLVADDDIALLSANWGSTPGNPIVDVGPSTDFARRSRPMPDDVIDIEDLMMFAMNYENTDYDWYPRTFPEAEPVTIALHAQTTGDRLTLSLELGGNTGFVKGLDIPIAYGSGLHFLGFETGEVWPEGSLLLHTDSEGVVTLSGATLGADPIVEGNGVIATLSFAITGPSAGFALEHMVARTHDNREIEVVNNPAGNVDSDDLINVVPEANYLGKNFPNPFSGGTTIQYGLKEAGSVKLSVYNTRGQLIRTLVNESKGAGTFQANWNGRDASGQKVSAGVYFFRLETSEGVKTAKGLMIK